MKKAMQKALCWLLIWGTITSFGSGNASSVFGGINETGNDGDHSLSQLIDQMAEEVDFERMDVSEENDDPEEKVDLCTELATTEETIWQIRGETIVCTDHQTREVICELPALDLVSEEADEQEELLSLYLLQREDDHVGLCTVLWNQKSVSRVTLYALQYSSEGIVSTESRDLTADLGHFFDPAEGWLEIDLVGCGNDIYLGALDRDYFFNMYFYVPETGTFTELGKQPLLLYSAAVPLGDRVLLAGFSVEADNAIDVTMISVPGGEILQQATIETGTAAQSLNFAYDAAENRIYFTVNSTAYRANLSDGAVAEAFGVFESEPEMNRTGILLGDDYLLRDGASNLMALDIRSEITSVSLRVSNLSADYAIENGTTAFNLENPDYLMTVSDGGSEENLLDGMLNQSIDYDAFTISASSEVYRALRDRGYLVDLSGSATLMAAVESMTDAIQGEVIRDGALLALPLSVENVCMTLNTGAISELTGLKAEEIPRDWVGFLDLLSRLAEEGSLIDHDQYTLVEASLSMEFFQEWVFSAILRDSFLWLHKNGGTPEDLREILLPALRKLSQIDWTRLGLAENDETDLGWLMSDSRSPIISEQNLEILVMQMEDGTVFWPLSMREGEEPLIPQDLSVLILNPYSLHQEALLKWAEYVWNNNDPAARMSLCPGMGEPIINTAYQEDIAFFEEMIPQYAMAIEAAETSMEAEMLQAEMEEMMAFLEDYRENARWTVSEKSIENYWQWESSYVPDQPVLWSADEEDAAVLQFLDGMMTAEVFLDQLIAALNMAQMEGF